MLILVEISQLKNCIFILLFLEKIPSYRTKNHQISKKQHPIGKKLIQRLRRDNGNS